MILLLPPLILLALLALAYLISALPISLTSAPFVPVPTRDVAVMVRLSGLVVGQRVMDLGSGDGRLVLAFARNGVAADGVELQPLLVWWSRFRGMTLRARSQSGSIGVMRIWRQDLWTVDVGSYDAVVFYALPKMMERLKAKLETELRPGARVVSYAFPVPGWEPERVEGRVFVYQR
jgi:SAM-dependent methyltransferase